MTRHTVILTTRPPNLIQRLWYWHLRLPVPHSVGQAEIIEAFQRPEEGP